MNVSKLDAAKRQLEAAIYLFFRNGDPISTHTLTGAAYEIFETLCDAQGVRSIIAQGLSEMIRPDKQAEVRKKLNDPKNFFKHADKDPKSTLDFNPEVSAIYMWDAIRMYRTLTSEFPKIFKIFTVWFSMKNPDLLSDETIKQTFAGAGKGFDLENRAKFLQDVSVAYDVLEGLGKI